MGVYMRVWGQHTGISFLYKEAAKAYQEAYKICEQPDMLKAYLYSCYRALPHEEYIKLLSGNPVFLSLDTVIQNEIDQTKKKLVWIFRKKSWKNGKRNTAGLTNTAEYDNISKDFSVIK